MPVKGLFYISLTLFQEIDPTLAVVIAEFGMIVMLSIMLCIYFTKTRTTMQAKRRLDEALDALAATSEREVMMRAIAEHASDGLVFQDMTGRILWANPAFCRSIDYGLDEILGRRPHDFLSPPPLAPDLASGPPAKARGDTGAMAPPVGGAGRVQDDPIDPNAPEFNSLTRYQTYSKSGAPLWQEVNKALVELVPGQPRIIATSRDVTLRVQREQEIEQARAELHHTATHDALTGLQNRTAFLSGVAEILARDDPAKRALGMLYLDMNDFKAINDTYGHAAGDAVLRHVAQAIRETAPEAALTCRMGGDEFVMAVPGVTDFQTLQMVADTLTERISSPLLWSEQQLECRASVGIALNTGSGMAAEELIRTADFALYKAKRPTAPSIVRYDAELHRRQTAEAAVAQDFAEMLDRGGIDFVYQPIVDARTYHVHSVEALARWTRSDGSVAMPDTFLRYAARMGRMADIDFAAMAATASLVEELQGAGHRVAGAFNVSSSTLAHPDFLQTLQAEGQARSLMPDSLSIEVQETTFLGSDSSDGAAADCIQVLRRQGYSVALDDFGVGLTGLSHLVNLDVSAVKLDRSLVARLDETMASRIITTSTLRLCNELGVVAFAEGVETVDQAAFLSRSGCQYLQGFGFARPMPRDAVIAMINAGTALTVPPPSMSAMAQPLV